MKTGTTQEKLQAVEAFSAQWLAKGNAYAEKGKKDSAEKCYAKSAYWLTLANKIRKW